MLGALQGDTQITSTVRATRLKGAATGDIGRTLTGLTTAHTDDGEAFDEAYWFTVFGQWLAAFTSPSSWLLVSRQRILGMRRTRSIVKFIVIAPNNKPMSSYALGACGKSPPSFIHFLLMDPPYAKLLLWQWYPRGH